MGYMLKYIYDLIGSNEDSEYTRPTKRFLKLSYVSRKCED
jgi:hypothetical protein